MTLLEKVQQRVTCLESKGHQIFNDEDWAHVTKICNALDSGSSTIQRAHELSAKWTKEAQEDDNPYVWAKVDRIDFVIREYEGDKEEGIAPWEGAK